MNRKILLNTCLDSISCYSFQNLTYISNPNFPSAFTETGQECKYTINAARDSKFVLMLQKPKTFSYVFSDICQLRLDFQTFELNQPPSGTTATTAGTCEDTFTVTRPTGGRQRFSALCGDLSGQHSKRYSLVHKPPAPSKEILNKVPFWASCTEPLSTLSTSKSCLIFRNILNFIWALIFFQNIIWL